MQIERTQIGLQSRMVVVVACLIYCILLSFTMKNSKKRAVSSLSSAIALLKLKVSLIIRKKETNEFFLFWSNRPK